MLSWGFLIQRADFLGIDLVSQLSRLPGKGLSDFSFPYPVRDQINLTGGCGLFIVSRPIRGESPGGHGIEGA